MPVTSIDRLVAELHALGVGGGDVVMVHASLRAMGPVEQGAEGVVEALDEAVGEGGTLMMTLGARDDFDWVNGHPEEERPALLAGAEPFDALTTPADPDVGVLAEVFRQFPGTVVSDHPDGRFAARGHRARHLVTDVPWHHYYGPGSPLERLVEAHGTVLRLGADIDTVTLLHLGEYQTVLPDKRAVRRYHLVASPSGPIVTTVECLDDSNGIVDRPGPDYFGVILAEYLATGRARVGTVGRARSELIDGADLLAFGVTWMTAHF